MTFSLACRLQTDCFNYIKILLRMNSTQLYVCGTYAFSPLCAYIVSVKMKLCLPRFAPHVSRGYRFLSLIAVSAQGSK